VTIGRTTFTFSWQQGPLTPLDQQGTPWAGAQQNGTPVATDAPHGLRSSSGALLKIPLSPLPQQFRCGDQVSLIESQREPKGLKRPVMLVNHSVFTREIFPWAADSLVPPPIKIWQIMGFHFALLIALSLFGQATGLPVGLLTAAVVGLLGTSLLARSWIFGLRKKAFLSHVQAIQDVLIDRDHEKFVKVETAGLNLR
jgi:hypothetical protein